MKGLQSSRLWLVIDSEMDRPLRFFVVLILSMGGSPTRAQVSPAADRLLNQTEASVLELVQQVQMNANRTCDFLSTCNSVASCSRLSCPLAKADTADYQCQAVQQNTNCKNNCSFRNFDFSQSFLRLPGVYDKSDNIPQRQLQEICAQKNLDSTFRKLSNNTDFFRPYFGSVTGTFRIFPGADEADCGSYDFRLRLGYLTATSNVMKSIMVVIDRGGSMANTLPSTSDTNLATAYRATESLLNTTTVGDYVNVFTFYGSTLEPFSPQPVKVTNASTHPDFGVFAPQFSQLNNSALNVVSNASSAILQAINSNAGLGNTEIPLEYLQVIVLFVDNMAVTALTEAPLPWALIKSKSVRVLLYMFDSGNSATDVSTMTSQFCAANGKFEVLNETVFHNPLLAMESFFSYLANVHSTYVNNYVDYSTEFFDYSQIDYRTFTLSKAAFSSIGELLGVVAINIFKSKLQGYGIDADDIEAAVQQRVNRTSTFNASGILTPTCLPQTQNTTCSQDVQASNIVCDSNFDTDSTALRELSCCGKCKASKSNTLALGLGLGLPAIVALICVGLYVRKQNRIQVETRRATAGGARPQVGGEVYSGSEDEEDEQERRNRNIL